MKPLCLDNLSPEETLHLGNLCAQPGYVVFKKLIGDACKQATSDAINLSPLDDDFTRKLTFLQYRARDINEFSATLIKSIEMYSLAAVVEEQQEEENPRKGLLYNPNKVEE